MTSISQSKLFSRLLVAAALCAGVPTVQAQDAAVLVEGQRLATRVLVSGAELKLNGSGVRTAGWFKGFVTALYLPSAAATAEQVQVLPGPKRLQLRLLHDVPATEFSKALRKGVVRNSSEAEAAALEPALARFEAHINGLKKVRKGDVVDIDQDTASSLLFTVNGTLRGQTPGATALYAALLRAFVGDKPYDDKLKAGLLGGPR